MGRQPSKYFTFSNSRGATFSAARSASTNAVVLRGVERAVDVRVVAALVVAARAEDLGSQSMDSALTIGAMAS
jgi:hypothetical protein